MIRVGSLCTGYAGLDMAAEHVTGGTTLWHCEYDAAPSKLLTHRYPGVPNFGDLKSLEWADHPVDVVTAGYPCQPFSGAGKRLGTEDPRHLFPFIAQGVERMRPPLLLLENVRGHLSLGFDVVLAELDRIGYDVRWTLLRAADVGAPHGRSRLWIAARAREAGGWPVPLGYPTALVDGDEWVDPASGLFGSIPAQRPGTAGVMVRGERYDHDATLAPMGVLFRTEGLLPTPAATDANGARNSTSGRKADSQHHSGDTLSDLVFDGRLLPTPAAQEPGGTAGQYHERLRRSDGRESTFLPLSMAVQSLALLPTPKATDGTKGGPNQRGSSGDLTMPSVVHTPWGPYSAAVRRWEALTRPAPAATEGRWIKVRECQDCGAPDWMHHMSACLGVWRKWSLRLSPAFVEWMQGLPAGWVTDLPGASRNDQLKMLGNGVVPQCAAAAYGLLGVADLFTSEVAA